jgi:cytochrome c oxidase subunit II
VAGAEQPSLEGIRIVATERTSRPRRRRRLGVAAAVPVVLLVSSGCSAREALSFNAPEGVTEQAPTIENLWFGAWVAALAVGLLTWGLILYAAVRFRRRDGDPEAPRQMRYNIPLEVMYTVVPLVMILGMFFFTARDQSELTKVSANPDNTVGVVGFRWSWAFNYQEGVYDVGTAEPDDNPTLWLPVNESVKFQLQSPDVVHSFWVPAFLMKMDVFPDRLNEFQVTPNKVGDYDGRCAELCGVDHARMLFNVKVVSQAEYDAHIAELRAAGQVGKIETDRISREGERYWEADRYPTGAQS